MKSIEKDFYCSAKKKQGLNGLDTTLFCQLSNYGKLCMECNGSCNCKYRKYPTPEQFKEEYGEEYPYDGAVYCFTFDGAGYSWVVGNYEWAKKYKQDFEPIVCACTPYGRPPDNWRPE
jgi:hypothetical protein